MRGAEGMCAAVRATAAGRALRCLTWNIHRARGNDGVIDPRRTLDVLLSEVWSPGTDALILTEADGETPPHAGLLDIARLETASGLACLHRDGATRWGPDSHGFLGVVLFLAPGLTVQDVALLDLPGHCHRGAVIADVVKAGCPLRLIGTHLSLSQVLRMAQLRTIGQHLARRDLRQTILCGDLNEWRPWGGLALSAAVIGRRFYGPARATFPIRRPVLPLDRVLTTAPGRVTLVQVLDGQGIRATSDHRPLRATVQLG